MHARRRRRGPPAHWPGDHFGLNTVGARIWDLLRPDVTDIGSVCATLGEMYPEVDAAELHNDVAELLAALESNGLVLPPAGQD